MLTVLVVPLVLLRISLFKFHYFSSPNNSKTTAAPSALLVAASSLITFSFAASSDVTTYVEAADGDAVVLTHLHKDHRSCKRLFNLPDPFFYSNYIDFAEYFNTAGLVTRVLQVCS